MSLRAIDSRNVGIKCVLALVLPMFPAGALAQCHFDPNNPVCIPDNEPGSVTRTEVAHWAAVAVSPSTQRSGSSHGQNSETEARRVALKNCATGAADCELVNWGSNLCFALAVNRGNRIYGHDSADNRAEAGTKALARCTAAGGKNCVVQASPCAGDDIRWPSPLPLPPPSSAPSSKIDSHTIGIWELFLNPGRWVWEIGSNGTYEFHSESLDQAPSHAGTFTGNDGHWSLLSTDGYSDSGTYKFQPPDSLVATGHLGTATWRRIK